MDGNIRLFVKRLFVKILLEKKLKKKNIYCLVYIYKQVLLLFTKAQEHQTKTTLNYFDVSLVSFKISLALSFKVCGLTSDAISDGGSVKSSRLVLDVTLLFCCMLE